MSGTRRRMLWAAGLTMLLVAAPCPAQDFNLSDNIELLATLQVAGEGYELALLDDWAFVAAGDEGFKVVDLRRPREPIVRGALSDVGRAVYVTVRALDEIYLLSQLVPRPGGGFYNQGVFVLRWNPALQRLNQRGFVALEDSSLPPTLESQTLDLHYPTLIVTATGSTIGKLIPVNIAVPDEPEMQSQSIQNLPFPALDSTISDRWSFLFYVAAGEKRLGIYESPHPPPQVIGAPVELANGGSAKRIELRDRLCHLAERWGGLRIIDVEDPKQPVELGSFPVLGFGEVRDLELDFPEVYLANGFEGVLVVDVQSATHPVELASVKPEVFNIDYYVRAISFQDGEDLAVFLTASGLLSIAQYPRRFPTPTPDADLNDDGRVDSLDAFLLGRDWQARYPTPTPAPE